MHLEISKESFFQPQLDFEAIKANESFFFKAPKESLF
jgi:hypothetical protein